MTIHQSALGKGCSLPNPLLIERMSPFTPSRTDKGLGERFGISYGTWRKLVTGQPVRASLIERLERRVSSLEAARARLRG